MTDGNAEHRKEMQAVKSADRLGKFVEKEKDYGKQILERICSGRMAK